uniref:Cadherin domain-containing protein n=1 Tax=Anisakis simplex TaxID=6269 RepID=A0A0M3JD51_ANISI
LNSQTIHIAMADNPKAFAYIFEFSTMSTSPDDWMFAGASVRPEVTFTIPDPCRDYQFRVLIVLRSTNPAHQLMVLRPRAIKVELPEFVVDTENVGDRSQSNSTAFQIAASMINHAFLELHSIGTSIHFRMDFRSLCSLLFTYNT